MSPRHGLGSSKPERSAFAPKDSSRSAGLTMLGPLVTRPDGSLCRVSAPGLPATREEALRLAARDNPDVISAVFTELAARDDVDVVRGRLLPQISLIGDLNRASSA